MVAYCGRPCRRATALALPGTRLVLADWMPLTDPDPLRRDEFIARHREVRARRATTNATREIETRGVAGTDPAVAGSRHACSPRRLQSAAEVRADADHDQPLLMAGLCAIGIGCPRVFPQRVVASKAVG